VLIAITLPREFHLTAVSNVVTNWPNSASLVEVVLHPDQWVEPAGLAALACLIDRTRRDGGTVKVTYDNCARVGYWERMGFFRELNLPGPVPSGSPHPPGGRFAEIRRISDLNYVDDIAGELMEVIQPTTDERRTLGHILTETMNNVCQHSGAHGFSSAQYWSSTKTIKFCIADFGCGLRSALSPRYQPSSDRDAVDLALQVGVTSRPPNFGQPQMRNRGVGLSCAHRLVTANGGTFDIWSGTGRLASNSIKAFATNIEWTGTLVGVTMQRDCLAADFRQVMSSLAEELRLAEKRDGTARRHKVTP
jgi:hypothetical protein